jgi:hypothetical protein
MCLRDLRECVPFYFQCGFVKGSTQHGLLWFVINEKTGHD